MYVICYTSLLLCVVYAGIPECSEKERVPINQSLLYLGKEEFCMNHDGSDSCIWTEWITRFKTKYVASYPEQPLLRCCPGHIQVDNNYYLTLNPDDFICKPICYPPCKNGYCASPGTCHCWPGYQPTASNNRLCEPTCSKDCKHGTCVAPNTCQCEFAYHQTEGRCKPICSEPCPKNSVCGPPENCQCDHGYRMLDGVCQPYCSSGCDHGMCVAPETCVCNPGWSFQEIDSWVQFGKRLSVNICKPQCEFCGNGTCVAPNVCECLDGFEMRVVGGNGPICVAYEDATKELGRTDQVIRTKQSCESEQYWLYIKCTLLMLVLSGATIAICIWCRRRIKTSNDGKSQ